MKTLITSFYSGPGTGKSTMAARVFSELKDLGLNVEYATEYAKDLTWQRSQHVLQNQIYIFGKQQHRLWRLRDQVDVIVTDSPLLMGLVYDNTGSPALQTLAVEEYQRYNNLDIFLKRVKPFNPKGRNQDEEESKILDKIIHQHFINLTDKDFDLEIAGHKDSVPEIVGLISSTFYSQQNG